MNASIIAVQNVCHLYKSPAVYHRAIVESFATLLIQQRVKCLHTLITTSQKSELFTYIDNHKPKKVNSLHTFITATSAATSVYSTSAATSACTVSIATSAFNQRSVSIQSALRHVSTHLSHISCPTQLAICLQKHAQSAF